MAVVRLYALLSSILASVPLLAACGGVPPRVTDASASLYTRQDSDHTEIWSPRASVAATLDDSVAVQAAYAMDAWTSASIDIRSSATVPVHELRHELEAGTRYVVDDVTVSGSYRYSTENDYWSHGGVVGVSLDLAQRNTTLALDVFGARDLVGRHGDAQFERPLDSAGARLTWTQVLGERSLAQLSWETTFLSGYQASPYRWVAVGGSGVCAEASPYCVPEEVPNARYRHALGARYRHALGSTGSLGMGYRLYLDSWGLMSHTLEPDASFQIGADDEISVDYRYYTQNEAGFYRPRYRSRASAGGLLTRDRKLSAFYSHALGAAYAHRWPLGRDGVVLSLGARASGTLYEYLEYVGLAQVRALELTGVVRIEHR